MRYHFQPQLFLDLYLEAWKRLLQSSNSTILSNDFQYLFLQRPHWNLGPRFKLYISWQDQHNGQIFPVWKSKETLPLRTFRIPEFSGTSMVFEPIHCHSFRNILDSRKTFLNHDKFQSHKPNNYNDCEHILSTLKPYLEEHNNKYSN